MDNQMEYVTLKKQQKTKALISLGLRPKIIRLVAGIRLGYASFLYNSRIYCSEL